MERIKNLNSYQKGVLIFMTVMTLIFAIIYPKTITKDKEKFLWQAKK